VALGIDPQQELEAQALALTQGDQPIEDRLISQSMSLLSLAPDVQEAILFLPQTERGRDPFQMRHLLPIAQVADWKIQRQLWAALTGYKHDWSLKAVRQQASR
jgi:hypothetical protein